MTLREAPVELPALQLSPGTAFGIYVHVPFCITRCGYCDFNTYTPAELGGVEPGRMAGWRCGRSSSWRPRGWTRRR